eukprot:TRINITY_DN2827_c0_g1_i1.p1 TRINITY_DN2827_c0_g1~~TRINITY_DN2827_c0_g1_i1.p1  ORF type:complete len:451 (+),score=165.42 TRINITY_DN2827_c0_g1_i1:37-1353(+)
MKAFNCLVLCLLFVGVFSFYTSKDKVVVLDQSNFDKEVIKSSSVYLVEFYAEWCGHCKALAPQWKKAANALNGIVKVGAMDAADETNAAIAQKYQIQGFPTIKIFVNGKPIDYQGSREASAIVEAGMKEARKLANARLNGKGGNSGSGSEKKEKAKRNGEPGGGKHVVTLGADNFDELVFGGNDLWLIEFYAPWCGHCKSLAGEWAQAADRLRGQVKLGAIDATEHQALAQKFGVKGYPTIKVFAPSAKSPRDAMEYQGGRSSAQIIEYALQQLEIHAVAPEIKQLTTKDMLEEECGGSTVCVISLLPHILDTGKDGRQSYIDTIAKVAKSQHSGLYRFFWMEGGSQPELEEKMNLNMGYPVNVAVSLSKNRYSIQSEAFDEKFTKKFLVALSSGRTNSHKLQNIAEYMIDIQPWDGEDAEMVEEEFDLADIMGDDEL